MSNVYIFTTLGTSELYTKFDNTIYQIGKKDIQKIYSFDKLNIDTYKNVTGLTEKRDCLKDEQIEKIVNGENPIYLKIQEKYLSEIGIKDGDMIKYYVISTNRSDIKEKLEEIENRLKELKIDKAKYNYVKAFSFVYNEVYNLGKIFEAALPKLINKLFDCKITTDVDIIDINVNHYRFYKLYEQLMHDNDIDKIHESLKELFNIIDLSEDDFQKEVANLFHKIIMDDEKILEKVYLADTGGMSKMSNVLRTTASSYCKEYMILSANELIDFSVSEKPRENENSMFEYYMYTRKVCLSALEKYDFAGAYSVLDTFLRTFNSNNFLKPIYNYIEIFNISLTTGMKVTDIKINDGKKIDNITGNWFEKSLFYDNDNKYSKIMKYSLSRLDWYYETGDKTSFILESLSFAEMLIHRYIELLTENHGYKGCFKEGTVYIGKNGNEDSKRKAFNEFWKKLKKNGINKRKVFLRKPAFPRDINLTWPDYEKLFLNDIDESKLNDDNDKTKFLEELKKFTKDKQKKIRNQRNNFVHNLKPFSQKITKDEFIEELYKSINTLYEKYTGDSNFTPWYKTVSERLIQKVKETNIGEYL